jgi:hypothetical protein
MLFQDLGARKVVADFSGGFLSSEVGALLLQQVDAGLGISRALAACFRDERGAATFGSSGRENLMQLERLSNFAFLGEGTPFRLRCVGGNGV